MFGLKLATSRVEGLRGHQLGPFRERITLQRQFIMVCTLDAVSRSAVSGSTSDDDQSSVWKSITRNRTGRGPNRSNRCPGLMLDARPGPADGPVRASSSGSNGRGAPRDPARRPPSKVREWSV